MAEKYGEIPKKFTKKWWQYFWDYYKVHTIVIIFALLMLSVLFYQYATKVKYDMYITYTSSISPDEDYTSVLQEKLYAALPDTDNNGEKNIYLGQYVFSDSEDNDEFTETVITRFQFEFMSEDSMLFIFSDEKSDYLFKNVDLSEDAFLPASQWLDEGLDIDNDMLYYSDGVAYGVSLSKSALNPNEYPNYYIALRKPAGYDEGVVSENFENAKKVANAMILAQ